MRRNWRPALLAACLSLACTSARADLRLSFHQTRRIVDSSTLDRDSESAVLSVILGKTYFWVDVGDYRRIYDFRKGRLYTLHMSSKTYLNDSLQSVVAFREVEMRSRMGVGPFVKIEGLAASPRAQFELANLFGMTIEGMNVPAPKEAVIDGRHSFSYEGDEAVAYELADQPLDADLRDSFAKFVAYECSTHPFIRRKLSQQGRIFKRLVTISHMGPASRRTEVVLSTCEPCEPPSSLIPTDFSFGPEPGNNDPVLRLVCAVLNETVEPPTITSADLRKLVEKALADKDYAQALVYYFQNMLQFGDEDLALLKKISDAAGKDDEFLLINIGLKRNTREQARRAVLALDAIDRSRLKNAYVLDVFKADALSTAGRISQSKSLLIKAIRANPHLAGAYKDLGGILFSTFDMPGAWRCWETCLKICPGYSLLQKFDYYQERRRKRFPEFF